MLCIVFLSPTHKNNYIKNHLKVIPINWREDLNQDLINNIKSENYLTNLLKLCPPKVSSITTYVDHLLSYHPTIYFHLWWLLAHSWSLLHIYLQFYITLISHNKIILQHLYFFYGYNTHLIGIIKCYISIIICDISTIWFLYIEFKY